MEPVNPWEWQRLWSGPAGIREPIIVIYRIVNENSWHFTWHVQSLYHSREKKENGSWARHHEACYHLYSKFQNLVRHGVPPMQGMATP